MAAAIAVAMGVAALPAGGAAFASEPASAEPADPLTAVYYRFSVVEYCSLVDPQVATGFELARDRILAETSAAEDAHRRARIAGWTAADLEWSNRGLGGFRRWCETEGAEAAAGFLAENAPSNP
ncbi:MAG: hypothetical protein SGJ07_05835 [Rhodospirillaceae bacterium]|nr:hypothetical protein [Rhodospirillaceae bacterium]